MSDPLKAITADEAALAAMTPGPWKREHLFVCGPSGVLLDSVNATREDCDGIARLRNRFGKYIAYVLAVEARAALTCYDEYMRARYEAEVVAARKAILEDTNGPS